MNRPLSWALIALLATVAIFSGALGSLGLQRHSANSMPIWLPSGIAVGLLVTCGRRALPGIFAGLLFAGIFQHGSSLLALGISTTLAAIGTLESALIAWITLRFAGGRSILSSPSSAFRFLTLAVTGPSLLGPLFVHFISVRFGFGPVSLHQLWFANLLSLVVLTPAIAEWSKPFRGELQGRRIEAATMVLLLVGLTCIVFLPVGSTNMRGVPLGFLFVAPLLWAALRLGQRITTGSILLLTTFAMAATVTGYGPFSMDDSGTALLLIQSYLILISTVSLIMVADVAQRKTTEEQLRASEHRYRELFEKNPQPIWFYDLETLKFLGANPAALRLYGYTQDEFLKMDITEIRPTEDIPALLKAVNRCNEHMVPSGQWRHRRKDGSLVWVEVSRQDIILGDRHAVLILCEDITQRKLAEQRFSSLTDLARGLNTASSPRQAARLIAVAADAMLGWDACRLDLCYQDGMEPIYRADLVEGRRHEFPPQEHRHLEYGPMTKRAIEEGGQLELREPGAGFPPGAVPFGDMKRPALSLMSVPVRSGKRTVAVLNIQSYRHRAYSYADLEILQSLADQCGGALERIGAVSSLVELNQNLEHHVAQRTAQLQATNKELEAFSYSVSHDLRAPLRSVRGFTEVLAERYSEVLDASGRDYLRRTCDAARTMERLIEDLLKLSRLGRTEMQWQRVDISRIANEIAQEITKGEEHRHVEWRIASGLSTYGDERLLRVLLDNLLRNAWKFTGKQDKPVIEVDRSPAPEHDGAFFVKDNGAGFDMQYAAKLFGVFQRLHSASDFPGTGVGLATAQRIITRHGGRIWAQAAVNQGATFFFTLPADERN